MRIELKCDSNGKFGFVETYKPYLYETGAIRIRAVANVGKDGYLSEPYIYRGGLFIPAKQIDAEMGIGKYIRAKKPFYSVLGTGNVIVEIRVAYDLKTKEYIKDKSTYSIFGVVKDTLMCTKDGTWSVEVRRLTSSSPELEAWIDSVAERVAVTGSDRELLLKSRF